MEAHKNKGIYWGLIGTFSLLYLLVAGVSLLHAIDFFGLGNNQILSILLASAYEVGQATVLFSLLTTHNKHKFMTWLMMFALTSLQIIANVFATFKFMVESNSNDWTYFQRVLLFWVDVDGAEMYMIIISWIIGALLPLVALGMIALVADNMKLYNGDVEPDLEYEEEEYYEDELDYEDEMEEGEEMEEEAYDEVIFNEEEAIEPVIEKPPVEEEVIDEEEPIQAETYPATTIDENGQVKFDFEDQSIEELISGYKGVDVPPVDPAPEDSKPDEPKKQ